MNALRIGKQSSEREDNETFHLPILSRIFAVVAENLVEFLEIQSIR